MAVKFPEEVKEGPYPKKIRSELNKNSKLARRPWEVKLTQQNKNEFHQTDEKVTLELSTIIVAMCRNGAPAKAQILGMFLPI